MMREMLFPADHCPTPHGTIMCCAPSSGVISHGSLHSGWNISQDVDPYEVMILLPEEGYSETNLQLALGLPP